MKILPTICIAMLCLSASAQIKDTIGLKVPLKDGKIIYEGIVEIPSKTKVELFKNAQQWFVDYFKNSNAVIQNQDFESGLIVGKGFIDFNSKVGLGITMTRHDKATIKIECKDNKFRYTIYDMIIYPPAYNEENSFPLTRIYGKLIGVDSWPFSKSMAKNVIENNDKAIQGVIESIKQAMNIKSSDF